MAKEQVLSAKVPEPNKFYSQAIKANGFLFVSGQVAIDESGAFTGGDAAAQTRQAFANMRALTEAAGATIDDVVKIVIYLKDVADTAAARVVRGEVFAGPAYPSTTLVANVALADPAWLVEIEAIVAL